MKVSSLNISDIIEACSYTLMSNKQDIINLLLNQQSPSCGCQIIFDMQPCEIPTMTIVEKKLVKNEDKQIKIFKSEEVKENEDIK